MSLITPNSHAIDDNMSDIKDSWRSVLIAFTVSKSEFYTFAGIQICHIDQSGGGGGVGVGVGVLVNFWSCNSIC